MLRVLSSRISYDLRHFRLKFAVVPFGKSVKSRVKSATLGQARSASTGGQFKPNHNWQVNGPKPKYSKMATLETLNFDNLALKVLPLDPVKDNYVRTVNGACFSLLKPTPVDNPETVAVSLPALELLDLDETQAEREEFAEYFGGNTLLPGSETAAHCYCGHQFGHFAGQLGDGAAIYLGEIINKKSERWEIQLKGAGLTPYSRSADGRKVLRSTIREFLCSEAMHHLGIPTTRAGCCVTSDTKVIRDIFYSGNPIQEKATIVLRIAPSFIRFGSFEIFKTVDPETGRRGPSVGRTDILKTLTEYVIRTFYPEIWESHSEHLETAYLEFYKEIVKRTARLVAKWQSVGWCHGVLNTDNMSIVGVTIDYGPYGFMDAFDPGFICNGSDDGGRYSYEKQPQMCRWNLAKLAESLNPLVAMEKTKPLLKLYDEEFNSFSMEIMRKKFGLLRKSLPEDQDLVQDFLNTMEETQSDFTNSFRCLSILPLPGANGFEEKFADLRRHLLEQSSSLEEAMQLSKPKIDARQLQMYMMLMQMQPEILAQLGPGQRAITRELERMDKIKTLKDMTDAQKTAIDGDHWDKWLARYRERLIQEAEGATDLQAASEDRAIVMNNTNPRFILRNYIAQNAIEAAEKGDYSEVRRVLKVLQSPYSDQVDLSQLAPQRQVGATGGKQELDEGASAAEAPSCGRSSHVSMTYDSKPPISAMDLRVT